MEVVRVVALGTSITASLPWTNVAEGLSRVLARPVAVEVLAAGGVTSRWGLRQTNQAIACGPDIVTVEFCMNDANWRRLVSREESRRNAQAMVQRFRACLPRVSLYLVVTNPVHAPRGLMRPTVQAYYGQYRRLAAVERTGLVDLAPAWAALSRAERRRAIPDGVHPSPEADLAVAVPAIVDALAGFRRA